MLPGWCGPAPTQGMESTYIPAIAFDVSRIIQNPVTMGQLSVTNPMLSWDIQISRLACASHTPYTHTLHTHLTHRLHTDQMEQMQAFGPRHWHGPGIGIDQMAGHARPQQLQCVARCDLTIAAHYLRALSHMHVLVCASPHLLLQASWVIPHMPPPSTQSKAWLTA